MKKRLVKLSAVLCASLLLGCPGAAEEKHIGNLIYVPAMTVQAQSGTYALRVEGLSLTEGSDEPLRIDHLAGAEFGVYVTSTSGEIKPWANPLYPTEPMRIRTGEGETRFSLPQGTEFFLRQESAPQGYAFDSETLIPVQGEEIVVHNAMAGQLVIGVKDTVGLSIPGVTFTVTDEKGVQHTLTADENGQAVLNDVESGVYTVAQSDLPDGVFGAISVYADRESDVTARDEASVSVRVSDASRTRVTFEHPASGAVQLNMQLAVIDDAGQTALQPLEGVTMHISGSTEVSVTTDETGCAQASLLEGEYMLRFETAGSALLPVSEAMMIVESGSTTLIDLTAKEPTGRIVLNAQASKAVSGGSFMAVSDATGREYGPYALDADGMAISEALEPGAYYVTVQAPNQTQLGEMIAGDSVAFGEQELVVAVAAGEAAGVQAQLLLQEKQRYELLTAQVDETGTAQESVIAGLDTIQLVDASGNAVLDLAVEDGFVTVEALTGSYTLRMSEKEAKKLGVLPDSRSFELPSGISTVTFPSVSTRLILTSVDETGMPAQGAVYLVEDAGGSRFEIVTDESGEAVTPLLVAGDVTVSTLDAPAGHDAAAQQTIAAQAGSAAYAVMTHERYGTARIAVQLQKLNERGEHTLAVLPGAMVEIRHAGEGQKEAIVVTVGEDGQAICALEAGDYTACIDPDSVNCSRVGEAVSFTVANTQDTDVRLIGYDGLGGVRVQMIGGELSDEELAQIRFEVVSAQGGVSALSRVGDSFYAGGLEAGEYTLRQTQMPEGYTLGADRPILISGGELTAQNMPLEEYAVLTVNKTGLTFNDRMQTFVVPLSGEYGVYTMEEGEMKPYPSADAQMTVWSNITPEQAALGRSASAKLPASVDGTMYYVREMTGAQGFAQDDAYREVLLRAGEAFTLESTVSSDRGFFVLEQLDALTGEHVAGGAYTLLDAQTLEPVLTFDMGDTAYCNPMAVPVGRYVLRQNQAASGYALSAHAQQEIIIEPYLTQGGMMTQATMVCAAIPQSEQVNVIADLYAANEQGLTLVSVDTTNLNPGETLILPQMTLTVGAQGEERSDIKSVYLAGAKDAQGGEYVARVEYCLADGGWQPSDARTSDVLSGPVCVSLYDVEDDVSAVRVTYLNAKTGDETVSDSFIPGTMTLHVLISAQDAVNMEAKAEFAGSFAYTKEYFGELMTLKRADSREIVFEAQGNGVFETAPAGRDGRVTGIAFFDTDADGVADLDETSRYAGMTVSLLSEAGEVLGTCRTNGQGAYSFDSLSGGVYTVQFDAGTDVVFSSGSLYSAQKVSSVEDTRYGLSGRIVIDGSHTDYVVNAGCLYAASLTGMVAERIDAQNASGFGGLSVEMRKIGGDNEEEPVVVITDESGAFSIGGILPGRYQARITLPQGYLCAEAKNGEIVREMEFVQGDKQIFGMVSVERGAQVSGLVRIDENGDGTIEADAKALEGVAVKLLSVADGHTLQVAETTTDVEGRYAFDMLPSGSYSVLFELPETWAFTRYGADSLVYSAAAASGSTERFDLLPGQDMTNINAGATIPAALTIAVFKDTQYDGQKGVYEEMLAGASVSLIRVEDGEDVQEQTVITGVDGLAVFENVSPGDYVLGYQMPGAWRATRQVDQQSTNYPVSCVPQSTLSAGRSGEFSLAMGQKDAKLYIGAMLSGSISGVMYYDDDADAKQAQTEAGVADMLVELIDGEGDVLAQMQTGADGSYLFEGLAPDRYKVRFTAPEDCGFSATERTMTRGGVQESDANVAETRTISLASGASVATADAGVVRLGAISGVVWEDSDADRMIGDHERRLAGVEVALMNGTGRIILTSALTDEQGQFTFPSIRPGQYLIRVSAPDGYVFSGAAEQSVLPVNEIRENRAYSSAFTLLGGAVVENIGYGLFTQGTISGMVWQDTDFDAVISAQETGLRGAVLTLVDENGETVAVENSLRSGEFRFDGLTPGEYGIHIALPEGYVFTRSGGGSLVEDTGSAEAVLPIGPLAMGQTIDAQTIGALKPASVGGVVWMDADNDGRRQLNDQGMQGVKATLSLKDEMDSFAVYTDETGAYRFDGVLPGSYTLTFELPQGHAFAKNAAGTKRVSCVPQTDALTGTSEAFSVISDAALLDMDVGVVGVGTIDGMVWEDREYNGRFDQQESGVPQALIELVDAKTGETAVSAYSGEDGRYLMDFVRTGEYVLRVTLPDGMIFTCEGDGEIAGIDDQTGKTQPFALKMGEGRENVRIGAIVPASVEGSVFVDNDESGIQEEAEAGLAGAVITLMQGGTVIAATETDKDGYYVFDAVRPGQYRVRAALPKDTLFIRESWLTLADPDASEGETLAFSLEMGDAWTIDPIAAVRAASIHGSAWSDDNADGVMDPQEPALHGTMAELIQIDSQGKERVLAATTVDAEGAYAFDMLRSGDYAVRFTLPADRIFAHYLSKEDGSAVPVVPGNVGMTLPMTLEMGEKKHTIHVGGILPGSIGDSVWLDRNGNGLQDYRETLIPGVTLNLLRVESDGSMQIVQGVKSDRYGYYSFDNLRPGTYIVSIDLGEGDTLTFSFGEPLGEIDSDFDTETGMTAELSLMSGQVLRNIDAGFTEKAE